MINRMLVGSCLILFFSITGCSEDSRQVEQKQRNVKVRTVTHFGQTLDPNATPEQVAFVALRAIREDFLAANTQARESALDIQFDVCASGRLQSPSPSVLTDQDYLNQVVNAWTPAISHYADDFDVDWQEAQERFVRRGPAINDLGIEECDVLIEVDDIRAGNDPNARVVVVVWLVRDGGYWRVTHVGFDSNPKTPGTDVSRRKITGE